MIDNAKTLDIALKIIGVGMMSYAFLKAFYIGIAIAIGANYATVKNKDFNFTFKPNIYMYTVIIVIGYILINAVTWTK